MDFATWGHVKPTITHSPVDIEDLRYGEDSGAALGVHHYALMALVTLCSVLRLIFLFDRISIAFSVLILAHDLLQQNASFCFSST